MERLDRQAGQQLVDVVFKWAEAELAGGWIMATDWNDQPSDAEIVQRHGQTIT